MIGLVALAMLTAVPGDFADKLYLTCNVSAVPNVKVVDLYRVIPPTREKFIEDVWTHGAVGLVMPPPETWIIDRIAGTIVPGPGSNLVLTFHHAQISDAEISASLKTEGGYVISMTINRINGTLEYTTVMPGTDVQSWRAKHGKPHPAIWSWTQKCTSSQAPIL